jgi:subtilisin family serine protease
MKSPINLFCTAALLAGFFTTAHAAPRGTVPGRFIVLLKRGAATGKIAAAHAVGTDAIYTSAINGFAGAVPVGRLAALKRHADVLSVEPDMIVSIGAREVIVTGNGVNATGESVPTGVDRANAELNPLMDVSSVGIAIIDTGISRRHPELNVAGAVSFVRGNKTGEDDNGHGSHVAGIAAAKLNGGGIRGMAPNARLFGVKVLDRTGSGQLSRIISGIDWVTRNAASKGIKVANLSFGFQGNSSSLNLAISTMVAAGVTTVVAAGNNGADASGFSPANHPLVICVSAIADSDGQPGSFGRATSYGADDTLASFSNYGSVVAIAAPGVNIYSTYRSGRYATMSGTSMASPHVAGAAALYIADHPGVTPATVKAALIGSAWPQGDASTFVDDRDNSPEPLLNAADL